MNEKNYGNGKKKKQVEAKTENLTPNISSKT